MRPCDDRGNFYQGETKQLPPIAVSPARRILGEEATMSATGPEVFGKTLQTANILARVATQRCQVSQR